MATAFIGLSVKVLLNNGMSLKGHVSNVDPVTQRLVLQDVVIQQADEKTVRVLPSFSVAGGEIKDLQVLPTQPAIHPPPILNASGSPSGTSTVTSTPRLDNGPQPSQHQHQHQSLYQHMVKHEHVHAPLVAPSPSLLPAHPHPSAASGQPMPYHDPAIISFTPPSVASKQQQQQQQQFEEGHGLKDDLPNTITE
ncbi:hypothetical protein BGZ94_002569 [Podila epigama]|nr:hypothetical protein BGZ94_002569 [Podila epigama]